MMGFPLGRSRRHEVFIAGVLLIIDFVPFFSLFTDFGFVCECDDKRRGGFYCSLGLQLHCLTSIDAVTLLFAHASCE